MSQVRQTDLEMVWRNTRWGRNTQYLKHDEVESICPKLWRLLQRYGSAFDDRWGYRKTEKYVLRFPVWDKPQSGSFWEDKDLRRSQIQHSKNLTDFYNDQASKPREEEESPPSLEA